MKTYLVTYDLIGPESRLDYTNLTNELKTFEKWAKPLESVWLIQTNISRDVIMEKLRRVCDFNDKILVIEVTNDWISINIHPEVVNWMKGGL